MKHVQVKFNADLFKNQLLKKLVIEQTKRLESYAERELKEMAQSRQLQNATGTLLDSLVWGVFLDGQLRSYGFYGGKNASKNATLHALTPSASREIDGRTCAEQFIQSYSSSVKQGWEIVWAVTAPYAAYWEAGHYNVFSHRYRHAEVITQRYDHIKNTLEPKCKVFIEINPPS